jgi:hypothetical protein
MIGGHSARANIAPAPGHGAQREEAGFLQPTAGRRGHNPFVLVNYSSTICLNPPP